MAWAATISSPTSGPSASSASTIGESPATSTRGAGSTGSRNTSIAPPDRQWLVTVTAPSSRTASSGPSGTIRSSSGSPLSMASSAWSRTLCCAQWPPMKPSIVPSTWTSPALPG